MPLTSDQQGLIENYTNELLGKVVGSPDSPEAETLTEWMTASQAKRLTMLKAWATQKMADDDTVIADQQTRLARMTAERDTRKPVLQEIAALTRLT